MDWLDFFNYLAVHSNAFLGLLALFWFILLYVHKLARWSFFKYIKLKGVSSSKKNDRRVGENREKNFETLIKLLGEELISSFATEAICSFLKDFRKLVNSYFKSIISLSLKLSSFYAFYISLS